MRIEVRTWECNGKSVYNIHHKFFQCIRKYGNAVLRIDSANMRKSFIEFKVLI